MAKSEKTVSAEVTTELIQKKVCKSCVRYESVASPEGVTTSLYLQNSAFEALGKPTSIKVTVSAITV